MKTILAAWIAAILLLLLASVILAGPDEDARAALALAKAKAMPPQRHCYCNGDSALCSCDPGQCECWDGHSCFNARPAAAPSASQQRQIDALPPGTVYQIRRPDGTLTEPRTKPGAAVPGSTPATFRALPMRWSAGPQMCSPGGA